MKPIVLAVALLIILNGILFEAKSTHAQDAQKVSTEVGASQSSKQTKGDDSLNNTTVKKPVMDMEPISVEDSLKMRDPFRKPIKLAAAGSDLALPDLERYGTDQIKIVGIITGPKKPKALVVTPNNKMFIVSENDRIGIHKGVIKKIGEKSLIVREKIVNLVGQEESTDTEVFYSVKKQEPGGSANN